MEPGAVASEVARSAGIHLSQLFRWRHELCVAPVAPVFSPVAIVPGPEATPVVRARGGGLRCGQATRNSNSLTV
jgi:transposase